MNNLKKCCILLFLFSLMLVASPTHLAYASDVDPSIETQHYDKWDKIGTITVNVPTNKIWKIKFTKDVDSTTLQDNIRVIEKDTLKMHPIQPKLSITDARTVEIEHTEAYKNGKEYELYIEKGIKSIEDNSDLQNAVVLNFTVENTNIPTMEFVEAKYGDIIGVQGELSGQNYIHYGIYIGDNKVIHYSSSTGAMKDGEIIEESMEKSFPVGKYFVLNFGNFPVATPDYTVEQAKSKLGEQKYDLITNNCEHFAIWCKTGESISYQIQQLTPIQIEYLKNLINQGLLEGELF